MRGRRASQHRIDLRFDQGGPYSLLEQQHLTRNCQAFVYGVAYWCTGADADASPWGPDSP